MLPARESWVPNKPEEVHSGAVPDYGISRVHSGHYGDGDKASIRQAKENQGRVPEVRKGGSGFSQIIITVDWENECHFTGNSPDPFVLLTLVNTVVCCIEQGSPGL